MSYKYQSNITNNNLSTPEILKQVCRPVPCVSSCRMKMQPHACYLTPCAPEFSFNSADPSCILFQRLSEGQCLTCLSFVTIALKRKKKKSFFFNIYQGRRGLQVSKVNVLACYYSEISNLTRIESFCDQQVDCRSHILCQF